MSKMVSFPTWSTIMWVVAVIAALILVVYVGSMVSLIIGLLLIAAVALIIYYIGARLDSWARHGGFRRVQRE